MTGLCSVDWPAFGLESPPETPWRCRLTGVWHVRQGCVHEHIAEAWPCSLHLAIMLSYESADRWGCARCLPEQCRAPLIVHPAAGCCHGCGHSTDRNPSEGHHVPCSRWSG